MERHPLKISVVIPAYNEASTISPTLTAILAQDYPDFEVIVVDNASIDNTSMVVDEIISARRKAQNASEARPKIRLVHESKKGLLHARERGRKEATGDIVANMDADCLPEKNWLSLAAKYFSHNNVVAVSGPYDYFDAHPTFRTSSLLMQNYIYRPIAYVLQLPFIRGGAVLIGGNNLIRADILQKMGGYNTSLVFYGEDTDTAKRVAKHGKVVFNPKIKMKTSARRFKKEGTLKMTARYLFYFFKHTLRG
ncbi:MAG: glycosyltransferase family 2 protein [Candidatus Taylorbacteria bacterium]